MQLRLAQLEDLSDILPIYESAIQLLAKQSSTQWQDGYGPTKENIQVNILNQELYLLINDSQIVALGTLQAGVDPVYSAIIGQWKGTNNYLSIHRISVNPLVRQKGYAKKLLQALILQGRKLGYHDFRIDTHRLNKGMQKAILDTGFQFCGEIYFPIPDGHRYAYQLFDKVD